MISKNELYELYVNQQLTDAEIATHIQYKGKCGKQHVYNLRKKYGIAKLNKWERHLLEITDRQKQIIMGGLLGDASVSNGKKKNKDTIYECQCCLEFMQGPKQEQYLKWKYNELKIISASPPAKITDNKFRFRTFAHPCFTNFRKEWYPDGKKRVPYSIFDLNALGLAIWFMDDGRNESEGLGLALCTCAFDRLDHDILINMLLKNFDISSKMRVYNGYNMLYIDLDYRDDFLKIITPYCPHSMNYKLNRRRLDNVLSKR